MGLSAVAGRSRAARRRSSPRWANGWAGIGRFCSGGAPTRTCWPPGTPRGPFKDALNNARKYVASSNPTARLGWPNSTLLHGDVPAAVADLKQSSGTKLVIMGSGVLIGSLMAANLIDEYLLMIHPLVLGTGRRLFPEGVQVHLRLADSLITSTGVVIASYELTRDQEPLTG
jgi:dihydrofolate reductase